MILKDCTPLHAQEIMLLLLALTSAIFIALYVRFPHIAKGDFKSKRELKKFLTTGYVVMGVCIVSSMIVYNLDNPYYSIFRHTFSFLGAWRCDKNPNGWFLFSLNMFILAYWSYPLVLYIGKRLKPLNNIIEPFTTAFMLLGCMGMMLVGCFPDTDKSPSFFSGAVSGDTHIIVSIVAFGGIGIGLLLNGFLLIRGFFPKSSYFPVAPKAGRRKLYDSKILKPYIMITVVFLLTAIFMIGWEIVWPLHYQPLGVGHWPGENIFSFPLWEWITIICIYIWLGWFPMCLPQEIPILKEKE